MSRRYQEVKTKLKKKAEEKPQRKKKENIKKIKTKGKTQSKKVAEKTLKENMKEEYTISLTLDGNFNYMAGMIIELGASFGKFSGKYIIDKVGHNISTDYICEVEASKLGARENAVKNAKEQTKNKQQEKVNNNKKRK